MHVFVVGVIHRQQWIKLYTIYFLVWITWRNVAIMHLCPLLIFVCTGANIG